MTRIPLIQALYEPFQSPDEGRSEFATFKLFVRFQDLKHLQFAEIVNQKLNESIRADASSAPRGAPIAVTQSPRLLVE